MTRHAGLATRPGARPRLHDLRHTAATRAMIHAYRSGPWPGRDAGRVGDLAGPLQTRLHILVRPRRPGTGRGRRTATRTRPARRPAMTGLPAHPVMRVSGAACGSAGASGVVWVMGPFTLVLGTGQANGWRCVRRHQLLVVAGFAPLLAVVGIVVGRFRAGGSLCSLLRVCCLVGSSGHGCGLDVAVRVPSGRSCRKGTREDRVAAVHSEEGDTPGMGGRQRHPLAGAGRARPGVTGLGAVVGSVRSARGVV